MKTFHVFIKTTCKVYMSIIKSIIHQRKSNFDLYTSEITLQTHPSFSAIFSKGKAKSKIPKPQRCRGDCGLQVYQFWCGQVEKWERKSMWSGRVLKKVGILHRPVFQKEFDDRHVNFTCRCYQSLKCFHNNGNFS